MTNTKPTHRALCPDCGRLAFSERILRSGSLCESHYVCPRGHGWQTRWTEQVA
jgi:hypothetical protein